MQFEGNQKFRELVAARHHEYLKCKSRAEKHRVSQQVIQEVHNRGGRFLERIATAEEAQRFKIPPCTQAWKVVDPFSPVLFVKAKQLMRDVSPTLRAERKRKRQEQNASKKNKKTAPFGEPPRQVKGKGQTAPAKQVSPPRKSSDKWVEFPSRPTSSDANKIRENMEKGGSKQHVQNEPSFQPRAEAKPSCSPSSQAVTHLQTPSAKPNNTAIEQLLLCILQQQIRGEQIRHETLNALLLVILLSLNASASGAASALSTSKSTELSKPPTTPTVSLQQVQAHSLNHQTRTISNQEQQVPVVPPELEMLARLLNVITP